MARESVREAARISLGSFIDNNYDTLSDIFQEPDQRLIRAELIHILQARDVSGYSDSRDRVFQVFKEPIVNGYLNQSQFNRVYDMLMTQGLLEQRGKKMNAIEEAKQYLEQEKDNPDESPMDKVQRKLNALRDTDYYNKDKRDELVGTMMSMLRAAKGDKEAMAAVRKFFKQLSDAMTDILTPAEEEK